MRFVNNISEYAEHYRLLLLQNIKDASSEEIRLMKKVSTILLLLCYVSVFAEEEGQDVPVAKGECISPFGLCMPLAELAFFLFIAGLVYILAEITGKRDEDNKEWWIIISLVASLVIIAALRWILN